jgi:thiosulfate/3-mercaptopyruvate sulfurtransferase
MSNPSLPFIVEGAELAERLGPDIIVADLSEYGAFTEAHIPGAVHLPYAAITASNPPVQGLMPSDRRLSEVFSAIGLTPERHVVAVDENGAAKAGRLIFTLHALGHGAVSLLNGGMGAWLADNLPTESGEGRQGEKSTYNAQLRPDNIADRDYILKHLSTPGFKVLDVRTPSEFNGRDARSERGGHIPGARQLEFSELLDRDNHMRLKPRDQIKAMLDERGITPKDEVVVHCQSHARSAHTYAALKALGYERVRGYPGAWSDWGNDPDTPIER